MRIGITYDLKTETPAVDGGPDDFQEEFDSPVTIEAIASVLRGLNHEVVKLGDGRELLQRLLGDPPDFVFNLAEGQGISRSREARVPAVLEMLGIPYSGSDPLTLAATLDKSWAKRLVESAGVAVPKSKLIPAEQCLEPLSGVIKAGDFHIPMPAIMKPAWEGSSKGIRAHSVVDRVEDVPAQVEWLQRDHRQPILVEEFIEGEELTVGIVGNAPPRMIGIMRVIPRERSSRFVYSLEVKRDFRKQVRYECPAQLPDKHTQAMEEAALRIYRLLDCRDVARVDFRLRDGVPYFLEVNPLPGLNPESSDLVILAQGFGWTYGQLIETILRAALDRQRRSSPSLLAPVEASK
jgi:D-alanine-D-alanine ligase